MSERITSSMADHIERSKREVTVLFTDIVGSTRFWDEHGDTVGRLMVDRHNRLLFPLVRAHGGRVIKTIGDSIMAAFRKPHRAIEAAVAMQQAVAQEALGRDLGIQVRIGMHTGQAIVERDDVYGDAVNLAARVEGLAEGGEILVSQATVARLGRRRRRFRLRRHKTFVPKGKSEPLTVHAANWRAHRRLVPRRSAGRLERLGPRQKLEVGLYLAVGVALVYGLYLHLLRYLLADFEPLAVALLGAGPLVLAGLIAGATLAAVLLYRARSASIQVFRALKGVFGFGLVVLALFFLRHWAQPDLGRWLSAAVHGSDHLFVEVLEDGTGVFAAPRADQDPLFRVDAGALFLQTEKIRRRRATWTKVLLTRPEHRYGYLPRRLPPRAGFPPLQVTRSRRFVVRLSDLLLLALGLVGFVWGFLSFRVRPL